MGHKPFLVVADYLTRRGIAVLRYDDRGTAASQGNHSKATTADFSDDAEAALDYLKTRKEVIPAMTYWIKATVK
jgi:alpha/beta superfamily hydrolase